MQKILFTLVLLTLMACSAEMSSEEYLDQAKNYIAESDFPAATIQLKNALRLDANLAEAHWLLGKIYLDVGDIISADEELQRAQELEWTANDVRPAIAKTLLAQGKFAKVLALPSQGLDHSAAATLFSIQAMAALSDNHADKARELVELALKEDPQLLEAKLGKATIAIREKNAAEALVLAEAILANAPDTGEAWWIKGHALVQQGKLEDARAAFDQSINLSTIAFADRLARALISLQLQEYDAVRADAAELLKQSPNNPLANYLQGMLDFHDKRYGKAIMRLSAAQSVARQFPSLLYFLSAGHLIEKNIPLAEDFGRQYVALHPNDGRARKLLAAILILQNKFKDAQDTLQPVLDQDPDDVQALNFMANALLLNDQGDIGMALYARIAQLEPNWPVVPLRQEAGLVTSSDTGVVDEADRSEPDSASNFPQTEILKILKLLKKRDFGGAIDVGQYYHYRDTESLAPYIVLGRIYLAAGRPSDAEQKYEQVLQREPGHASANLGLAQMALIAGDVDAARRYFKVVLGKDPDNLATLLQLNALEAREKNVAAMVAALKKAIERRPEALEPRLRLAGYYLGSGHPEKVIPLFADLSAMQRRSPHVLELIAQAQQAQKQTDSAIATLQQLVDVHPEYARSHYLLAMAACAAGDRQKCKLELSEAIARNPKHVLSLTTLASMAKEDGEQTQFEQYLATLVELAPDVPDVLRLRAMSAMANGDGGGALALAQRAFEKAPTTQTVLELTIFQKAAGKNEDALRTLQQWITKHPTDIVARLSLGYSLMLGNNRAGARAQYQAVLKLEPGNITALNNLAWDLRLENPARALKLIRSATEIAPDSPVLLDTQAVIEHLGGDHASAQRTIQRALEKSPGNLSMRFHQAMITAALGDKAQAITALEALLSEGGDKFPERAEAEKLLLTLKG